MSLHLGGPVGVPVPVPAKPVKPTTKARGVDVSGVPVAPRGNAATMVLDPRAGGAGRGIRHRGGSFAFIQNPGPGGESKHEYSYAPIEGEIWEVITKNKAATGPVARPESSAPQDPEPQTTPEELTANQTEIKQQRIVIMKGDKDRKALAPSSFVGLFADNMIELQREMRRQYAIVYFDVDPVDGPAEYVALEREILADWRRRIKEAAAGYTELRDALTERMKYYDKTDDDHVPLLDYEGLRMLPGYGLLNGIRGIDGMRIRRPRNQFGKWFRVFLQRRFEETNTETGLKVQGSQVAQPGMAQERREKNGVDVIGFETRDKNNPRILPDRNLIAAYNKGAAKTSADTPSYTLKLVEMIMERYQRENIVSELFSRKVINEVRLQLNMQRDEQERLKQLQEHNARDLDALQDAAAKDVGLKQAMEEVVTAEKEAKRAEEAKTPVQQYVDEYDDYMRSEYDDEGEEGDEGADGDLPESVPTGPNDEGKRERADGDELPEAQTKQGRTSLAMLEDERQAELAKRLARLSGLGGGERWNNALPWYRK